MATVEVCGQPTSSPHVQSPSSSHVQSLSSPSSNAENGSRSGGRYSKCKLVENLIIILGSGSVEGEHRRLWAGLDYV